MIALTARQSLILERLRDRGSCTIADLASHLAVSLETIRRDVKPLEAAREVVKRHGAVALPHVLGEAPFERRMRENAEAKRLIARHAARLIADGDSLMIDNGTTTTYFARELLRKRNLTVVTNSSEVARMLATTNGNRIYLAGGALNGANGGAFGPSAIAFAASFRVHHAVISIAAIDAAFGLSDHDLAEAEFARTVLDCGKHRMVLADSAKFGREALIRVAGFDALDLMVTDQPPPPALAQAMAAANLRCDVAPG